MEKEILTLIRSIKKIADHNGFTKIYKWVRQENYDIVAMCSKGGYVLYVLRIKSGASIVKKYYIEPYKGKITQELISRRMDTHFHYIFKRLKPTLHIPIGAAGSGKSTLVGRLKRKDKTLEVVSPDAYRIDFLNSLITKKYYDEAIENKVWICAYADLEKYMKLQTNVSFDATNLTIARRQTLMILARKYEYVLKFYVMPTTLTECLERNNKRHKVVPPEVIIDQFKSKELPHPVEYTVI